jgi:hypothetical protein
MRCGGSDERKASTAEELRSQIMISFALCALAESEIHAGRYDRAVIHLARSQVAATEILDRIGGGTVSLSAAYELLELMWEAHHRARSIESAIRLGMGLG